MKNKFQRMSRQERKELIKEYKNENDNNKHYISTLNRMLVLGIIGFVYGTIAILFDIFVLNVSFWTYIIDAVVMIFTVFLIVQRQRILIATMNNYAINKSKKEEEKKEAKKPKAKKSTKKEKEEVEMPKKKETKKASTKKSETKTTKKSTTTKKSDKKKTK